MKFAAFLVLASPLVAAGGSNLKKVTQPTKGQDYQADLFQGTNQKQLESHLNNNDLIYTQANGKQYFQPLGAQCAGPKGPLLLQDSHLIEMLATFNRERIPERIVHARGAGAHGFFDATTAFTENLSSADVFKKGTRTSVTMRFSTVGGRAGSADA